ncbi:hypothetical protein CPC08DRAFT_709497 [Agrocybe pediades]|nr:hypothetical protein CPC08DRAFT_709497 [Agrocybe pediades]
MHRCLEINEILLQILDYIACDAILRKPKSSPRKDLRSMALTSRLFTRPAMHLLWRSLNNPIPLLLTLPDDIWSIEDNKEHTYSFARPRHYYFVREPVESDWKRFDELAPLVEELGIVDRRDTTPYDGMLVAWIVREALRARRRILLPNLCSDIASSNDLKHIELFLTPKVRHLHVRMHPRYMSDLVALARDISLRSPNLRVLRLSESSGWDEADRNLFAVFLRSFFNDLQLEEFHCDWFPLTGSMTQDLLAMPALKVLNINQELMPLLSNLQKYLLTKPTLEKLHLSVNQADVHCLAQIVPLLLPSKLKVLNVISKLVIASPEEISELLSSIGRCCTPEQLIMMELILDHISLLPTATLASNAVGITFDAVRPILRLNNLRVVSITSYSVQLTDDDTKLLAMAWPHLETLHFDTERATDDVHTTLKSILYFAKYCKNLHDLSFRFADHGDVVQVPVEEVEAVAGRSLLYLSVGHSTIEDPTSVLDFLNFVFPGLKHLSVHPGNATCENWNMVQGMFQWR